MPDRYGLPLNIQTARAQAMVVRLHFIGVQGMSHSIHVEGKDVDEKFTLKRGHMHTFDLAPKTPGVIEIECSDHEPSMRGEIVVLPQ